LRQAAHVKGDKGAARQKKDKRKSELRTQGGSLSGTRIHAALPFEILIQSGFLCDHDQPLLKKGIDARIMSKQTRFVKVFLPFYDSHVPTASRQ
jgi:hypothetical protein